MILLVTAAFTLICVYFIALAVRGQDARHLVLGVLGLFALGHYVLPVLFRPLSHLRLIDDDDLFVVLFMSCLFFLALAAGFRSSARLARASSPTTRRRSGLDALLFRWPGATFAIFAGLYVVYLANSLQTIYQAGSVENFISQQGTLDAGLATLGGLAASGMAVTLAYVATLGRSLRFVVMLGLYLLSLLMLISTAQRAAIITPLISLAVAFALFERAHATKTTIAGAILLLIVSSPFLVLMRGNADLAGSTPTLATLTGPDLSSGLLFSFLVSILDRADGLLNMVSLKRDIDTNGFANTEYFYSLLVKYIPSFMYPGKPTAMSVTGAIDGHLSVIAWRVVLGTDSVGSLTVFGPITAYHEGGWPWLVMNGFLTGAAFNLLYNWLAVRSHWRRIIYISIFPSLCVENVPPSIFTIYTSFSTTFYILCFLAAASVLLRPFVRSSARTRALDSNLPPGTPAQAAPL